MSGKALASDSEDDERPRDAARETAAPPTKKAKKAVDPKGKAPVEDSGSDGDDSDADSVDSECVENLSGDEVDASNIIEGGRRARRGRPTTFTAEMYAKVALGSDSDDE